MIEHVAEAIEQYRAGAHDAYEVDELIHRYHEAARELWKFCFGGDPGAYAETVAATLERGEWSDWWEAAARRRG